MGKAWFAAAAIMLTLVSSAIPARSGAPADSTPDTEEWLLLTNDSRLPGWIANGEDIGGSTGRGTAAAGGPSGPPGRASAPAGAAPPPAWARTFAFPKLNHPEMIIETPDGATAIVGETPRPTGEDSDGYVMKLDLKGDVEWLKLFGGLGSERYGAIAPTADGGFIVAFETDSFGPGDIDAWIVKLSSIGDIEWQKSYGGPGIDEVFSIQQTREGGYVFAGNTDSWGDKTVNAWVVKLGAAGNVEWQNCYGGTGWDFSTQVQQTADAGFVVVGAEDSAGAGSSDLWVLKLDASGAVAWEKTFGGSFDEIGWGVFPAAGGYTVAGTTASFGAGLIDVWVLKLDGSGSLLWSKTYGGPGMDTLYYGHPLRPTGDGGFVLAAYSDSFGAGDRDAWVLKMAGTESVDWQKRYGGAGVDETGSVQPLGDGGFAVAFQSISFSGNLDAVVLKVDGAGNLPSFCDIVHESTAATADVTPLSGVFNSTVAPTTAVAADTSVVPQDVLPAVIYPCVFTITADETWPEAIYNYDNVTVRNGATLTIAGGSLLNVPGNVTLLEGAKIVVQGKNNMAPSQGLWIGQGVEIKAGNVQIDPGCAITADGQGYVGGVGGPGAGPGGGAAATGAGAGGSHGGWGGAGDAADAWSGPIYDSAPAPMDLGSGGADTLVINGPGGGGDGGGAIRLDVAGELRLDGRITAAGTAGLSAGHGGGAGGSIYVSCTTIAGSGWFSAMGGKGAAGGGGGGGGRVAVYFLYVDGFSGFGASTAMGNGGFKPGFRGTEAFFQVADLARHLDDPERVLNVYESYRFEQPGGGITLGGIQVGSPSTTNSRLTIAGGSYVSMLYDFNVTGNSTVFLMASMNAFTQYGLWVGRGVTVNAANVTVDAGSRISADAIGYVGRRCHGGRGPGGGQGAAGCAAGGSYGGAGAACGAALPGPTYGYDMSPSDLGSGGGGDTAAGCMTGRGGAGGGAMQLHVMGTLRVDGSITADGAPGWSAVTSGGGAGGAVFIMTTDFLGTGTIAADGGAGNAGGGGGGGGRIAVQYTGTDFPPANATARGGAPGGLDGTVRLGDFPSFVIVKPVNDQFAGTETVAWQAASVDTRAMTVDVVVSGAAATVPVATAVPYGTSVTWDTTAVPDGRYEIEAVFRAGGTTTVGSARRDILVNNAAAWHSGSISKNQTWAAGQVHAVKGLVVVLRGKTLTIEPGAVVKFAEGTQIYVASGGTLTAEGTAGGPIVLTALDDDSVGGDTNLDGGASVPHFGSWHGVVYERGAAVKLNAFTELRFVGEARAALVTCDQNCLATAVGVGQERFVSPRQRLHYVVFFSNAAAARAPARRIAVTDSLPRELDWGSVELVSCGFNHVDVPVPVGASSYETMVSVATDPNPVRVKAEVDRENGLVSWVVESVDAATGAPVAAPGAGFLPPNRNCDSCGEGYVSFTAYPKAGLADGSVITNSCTLSVDGGPPVDTNYVGHTLDAEAPSSRVEDLPTPSPDAFRVRWSGHDNAGSGLASYDVFAAEDGMNFEPWKTGTTSTAADFNGAAGRLYEFYATATDWVGNRETAPAGAQASTRVARRTTFLPFVVR